MIEPIENLMHLDEGVIGWAWRVAVARDSRRRAVGVPVRTIAYMGLQLSSIVQRVMISVCRVCPVSACLPSHPDLVARA